MSKSRQLDCQVILDELLKYRVVVPYEDVRPPPPGVPAFVANAFVVYQKDKPRLVIDYKKLNAALLAEPISAPDMGHMLLNTPIRRFVSQLDARAAFFSIAIHEDAQFMFAFRGPDGRLWTMTRMGMGVRYAPSQLQRRLEALFVDLADNVIVYLDDIIVSTDTLEEHVDVLLVVIDRLYKAGFQINVKKSQFCYAVVRWLGFLVSADSWSIDPSRFDAIRALRPPTTKAELRSILGLGNFFARFIPHYADVVAAMAELSHKERRLSEWSDPQDNSLAALKLAIIEAVSLHRLPADAKPPLDFVIRSDASDVGCAAMISYIGDDNDELPITFFHHKWTGAELNYSTHEQETLGALLPLEAYRSTLLGHNLTCVTDHKSLLQTLAPAYRPKVPAARIDRWRRRFAPFQVTLEHRPGTQLVVADALSRVGSSMGGGVSSSSGGSVAAFKAVDNIPSLLDDIDESKRRWLWLAHYETGHKGARKIVDWLKAQQLTWPQLAAHAELIYSACPSCQRSKHGTKLALKSIDREVLAEPLQRLSLDATGPFPLDDGSSAHALVLIDGFSRYVWCEVVHCTAGDSITASDVISFLSPLLTELGPPGAILLDNAGYQRCNELEDWLVARGVDARFIVPRASHQMGLVERVIRTLKESIRTKLDESAISPKPSLDALRSATASAVGEYNRCQHGTLNIAPYSLFYRRNHPASLATLREEDVDDLMAAAIAAEASSAEALHAKALAKANAVNSRYRLIPGSVAYLVNRAATKLDALYRGPFRITSFAPDRSFVELADRSGRARKVPIEIIKPSILLWSELESLAPHLDFSSANTASQLPLRERLALRDADDATEFSVIDPQDVAAADDERYEVLDIKPAADGQHYLVKWANYDGRFHKQARNADYDVMFASKVLKAAAVAKSSSKTKTKSPPKRPSSDSPSASGSRTSPARRPRRRR